MLKGAAIFAADLARRLTIDTRLEFVAASSYGKETRSSGTAALTSVDMLDIAGRDVLIVEDIIDSGLTSRTLIEALHQRGPASLALCTLLHKRVLKTAVEIRYIGFDIPDRFVVGYGMDVAERYRNLPDIRVLPLPPE